MSVYLLFCSHNSALTLDTARCANKKKSLRGNAQYETDSRVGITKKLQCSPDINNLNWSCNINESF